MATKLITAPAVEPVLLADAKEHLRYSETDQDARINAAIVAARRFAEGYTRRALITQTWEFYRDAFPRESYGCIELPFPPLQSVSKIEYLDESGVLTTLGASLYDVDAVSEPARIAPAYGEAWPTTRKQFNAVKITLIAGYGDDGSSVPEGITQGMLMMIGHLFERRESTIAGVQVTEVPQATEFLLDPYIVLREIV